MMRYGNAELHNVADFTEHPESGKLALNRLPNDIRLNTNERLRDVSSFHAAGCEIRFRLKDSPIKVTLALQNDANSQGVQMAELFYGIFQHKSPLYITHEPVTFTIEPLGNHKLLKKVSKEVEAEFEPELVRIVLPYDADIQLIDIDGDFEEPSPYDKPDTTLMTYGSSITNGSNVHAPSITYAMQTAHFLKMDYRNMGFGGGAKLDEPVADFIAACGVRGQWDVLTLEMGINLIWDSEYNRPGEVEEFKQRLDYFVDTIVKANPHKKVYCIDLFVTEQDAFGFADEHINKYRKAVKEKVDMLSEYNVFYVDGRRILDDPMLLGADILHPMGSANEVMAKNLARIIART